MVVGLDVTHPAPGNAENAPSIAGIVASVDSTLSQWPADLRLQESRKEMITDLAGMIKGRLTLYAKKNKGHRPSKVLVYRDGVSEGQYETVVSEEMPQIKRAFEETYGGTPMPQLAIIICGKRHNTRFYPTTMDDKVTDPKSGNPRNGTYVDRGVTNGSRLWEFFIQSHHSGLGTARPCHYIVVHDEIFRNTKVPSPLINPSDHLIKLTHNMCYLWGRATKGGLSYASIE